MDAGHVARGSNGGCEECDAGASRAEAADGCEAEWSVWWVAGGSSGDEGGGSDDGRGDDPLCAWEAEWMLEHVARGSDGGCDECDAGSG